MILLSSYNVLMVLLSSYNVYISMKLSLLMACFRTILFGKIDISVADLRNGKTDKQEAIRKAIEEDLRKSMESEIQKAVEERVS